MFFGDLASTEIFFKVLRFPNKPNSAKLDISQISFKGRFRNCIRIGNRLCFEVFGKK